MNLELLVEHIYEAHYGDEVQNLKQLLKQLKKHDKELHNELRDELGLNG